MLLTFFLLLPGLACAFNGHKTKQGPLTLEIGDTGLIDTFDHPYDVNVWVTHSGNTAIDIQLRMTGLIDQWYAVGQNTSRVHLLPGHAQHVSFRVAVSKGAFSALYPVHIMADFTCEGQANTAHAVRIMKTQLPVLNTERPTARTIQVPAQGAVDLTQQKTQRIIWQYFNQDKHFMPVGWSGSAAPSKASFSVRQVTRGTTKACLEMHPAWFGQAGTIFAEYQVQLPLDTPIQLSFANAIRNNRINEPASDGVSFRVWVNGQIVFDKLTDSKRWIQNQVDLSQYAGQQISLLLESHPGPSHNTTCDASYWGNPVIRAGTRREPLNLTEKETLRTRALTCLVTPEPADSGAFGFALDSGLTASAVLGHNGLLDGVIAFGTNTTSVLFNGLQVSILGQSIGSEDSPAQVTQVRSRQLPSSKGIRIIHHIKQGHETFPLTVDLVPDQSGLRVKVTCPKRITDIASGPFSQKANRVYWGHGYVIENPKAFRLGYGGHSLSTSHVGFDFEEGLSLLTASDNPPDSFWVDPKTHHYALHTHMDATLTFVPSIKGAFDCAFQYHSLYDKKPSPGFKNKAGRFVFDIWGGQYADNARRMQQMIDYGLTDSLMTLHVWQRWGYDYRLPDIYPPNPALGTLDDMTRMGEVCNPHNIPWGLHDNYIDFYPDANEFSYDHICFTQSGQPIKAWINEGRDAQSYRWRPDHIMPFVQRNLKPIKEHLKPTHYFIDVFSSINMFDFYDIKGQFHSSLETRQHWGDTFRWIQDELAGAVTTSEAGDDQLTGWLDGADCQHIMLSDTPKDFHAIVPCDDWERTPWFDMVLHDRFSLHGVGYSSRYEGGRGRLFHGIESNDYISDEILLGHALMMDRQGFGQGAVRKYWLAQDFIRSVATDRIASVEFADNNIHRQIVNWKNGAKVYVNRGNKPWTVQGKVLPEYGYYAVNGFIQSSIEIIDQVIVEQSSNQNTFYVNGRGYPDTDQLKITPRVNTIDYLGNNRFRMPIQWTCQESTPRPTAVFVHFTAKNAARKDGIVFQADHIPQQPTSSWSGQIVTHADHIVQIPQGRGTDQYAVLVGLWDSTSGHRLKLSARETQGGSYQMGTLFVSEDNGQIKSVRFVSEPANGVANPRWNPKAQKVNFGSVQTPGAFRLKILEDFLMVTPLPNMASFNATLNIKAILGSSRTVRQIQILDSPNTLINTLPFEQQNNSLHFKTQRSDFAYRIEFE